MENPVAEGSVPQKPRLKLSPKRKWLFRGLAVLGSIVFIEVVSFVVFDTLGPEVGSLRPLHQRQHTLAQGVTLSEASNEVIHPYLGWVHNPQTTPGETVFGRTVSVNALGFHGGSFPLPRRSKDTFIVGIFGGSVAWHTGIAGSPLIRKLLESDPLLEGKTVEVVLFAKSAYKQPQQLLAYNYLTAIGENSTRSSTSTATTKLRSRWPRISRTELRSPIPPTGTSAIQLADPSTSAMAFRLLELRSFRQTLAQRIDGSVLRWSWTANLVWHFGDQRAKSQLYELGWDMIESRTDNFIYHGPNDSFASDDAMHQGVVELWFRSSLQMNAGCVSDGTIYVHVLQPNQHLEGSKPIGPEEYRTAIELGLGVQPVRKLYPRLVKAGQELMKRGVRFSDQTLLFSAIEEPIYIDRCCHYNEKGNEMLAQKVAEELLGALRQQGKHPKQ